VLPPLSKQISTTIGETNLDLTGSIPTELALLTHLVLLDLSSSPHLVGTIPAFLLGGSMNMNNNLQALYLERTGLTGRLPEPDEGILLTDLRLSSTPGIQQYGLPTDPLFFQRMAHHLKWFQWSQEVTAAEPPPAAEPAEPRQDASGGGTDQKKNPAGMGIDTTSSGTIPSELGLLTRLKGLSLGTHNNL
jgi:hypothetical protein